MGLIRRTIKLHISEDAISGMMEEMIENKELISPVYGRIYRPIAFYTERKISHRLLALQGMHQSNVDCFLWVTWER